MSLAREAADIGDGPPADHVAGGGAPGLAGHPLRRAGFGVALLLAMAMPPTLQYSVGVLAPFLVEEAGVTRIQVGLYTSTLFVVSALFSPVLGVLVDRLRSRLVLSAIFGLGVTSAVLAASARSYWWLVASAVAIGLPMALSNPVTNRLVRAYVPAGSRGRLMGIKQSGVMVAQTLIGFSVGPLALLLGWRLAFAPALLIAACGLALTWWLVPAQGAAEAALVPERSRAAMPATVRWLALYAMFMGIGQACVGAYLPLYAYQEVGAAQATAGLAVGVFGAVATASRIGWAPAVERTDSLALPLRLISFGALPGVLLIAAGESVGLVALLVGVVVYGATAPVWNVSGMLAVFRLVGSHATGRASGFIYMGFSCGFVAGPVLFALLVEGYGYRAGWLFVAVATVLALVITATLPGSSATAASGDGE